MIIMEHGQITDLLCQMERMLHTTLCYHLYLYYRQEAEVFLQSLAAEVQTVISGQVA